jgi:hypothetical protein
MAEKIKETINHNFDAVNKYIDDQARIKKSISSWQYAKSISLILLMVGILFLLLAWAYNIFKKPNPELVQKINQVDRKIEQTKSLDKTEEKLIDGQIVRYNSETYRFLYAESDGYSITTRVVYNTTKDLLEGNNPKEITCYIKKSGTTFEFDQSASSQMEILNILGLSTDQAIRYKRFCKYDFK